MNSMGRILQGLLSRTADGTLNWTTTPDVNRFVASVDTISVVIQFLNPGQVLQAERYKLEVMNEKGVTVEALESGEDFGLSTTVPSEQQATSIQGSELRRLFTLARRSALDTVSTLEQLAQRLENSPL